MKVGLKTMQKEHKKFNIDQIETLHDDMADMLEINDEIQDALSRQYESPDVWVINFVIKYIINGICNYIRSTMRNWMLN